MATPDRVADPCPCDLGGGARPLAYASCCGRWHAGPSCLQAPDAPTLMRSRYSAYARGLADYLRATWHPSTRPAVVDPDPGLRWLGLEVRDHRQQDASHATVRFVARCREPSGRARRILETSRFVHEGERDGEPPRWFYVDGDVD